MDIVFIDGLHIYETVKEDILSWLPKVKSKGIICGLDYNNRYKKHVVKAVDEDFPKKSLLLYDDVVGAIKKLNHPSNN